MAALDYEGDKASAIEWARAVPARRRLFFSKAADTYVDLPLEGEVSSGSCMRPPQGIIVEHDFPEARDGGWISGPPQANHD